MGLQFERPVGSPRDVAELEYCSALRQTDLSGPLQINGSLTSDDVRLHVLSRHGVRVDIGEVQQSILHELAGGIRYEDTEAEGDVDMKGDWTAGDGAAGAATSRAVPFAGEREAPPPGGRPSVAAIPNEKEELHGDGMELVPETNVSKEENDGAAAASRPRLLHQRVTLLDLVQQVALLLIPELKKLRLASQEDDDDEDEENDQDDGDVLDDGGTSDPSHHEIRSALRRMGGDGNSTNGNTNSTGERNASRSPARRRLTLRTMAHNAQRGLVRFPNGVRDLLGTRHRAKVPVMDSTAVDAALLVLLENAGLVYGTELTADAIRKILVAFDEEALGDDDTIEQMIEQARGGTGGDDDDKRSRKALKLDRKTFLRALTNDLDMYDETTELAVTTHFEDANQMANRSTAEASSAVKAPARNSSPVTNSSTVPNGEGTNKSSLKSPPAPLKRVFTASSIDYTADTYASLTWAVFAWYLLAGFFFLYMFNELNRRMFPLACDAAEFGCKIANAVVLWLEIMIKLCVVGFVYVTLSALGNSVYLILDYGATTRAKVKSAAMILVSLATVLLSTVVAYFVQVDAVVFDTTIPVSHDDLYAYDPTMTNSTNSTAPSEGAPRRKVDVVLASTLVLGVICVAIQTIQLVRIFIPRSLDMPRLFEYAASSAKTMERKSKQAASHKVRQMVSHALACHRISTNPLDGLSEENCAVPYDARNRRRLAALRLDGRISHALLHFQELSLRKETVGGLLYTYRGFAQNGSPLTTKEGIWVFPRLLWCHLGQWIVIVGLIVILVQVPSSSRKT
jgi:hypothetical protein